MTTTKRVISPASFLPSPASKRRFSSSPTAPAALPLTPLGSDVLILVISYLKPWEVASLSTASRDLRALDLMTHIQVVVGKFRAPDCMVNHIQHLPRLQYLDLRGNRMSVENMRALASMMESSHHLERLDLSGMSIGSSSLRLLTSTLEKGNHRQVRSLLLSVNNLGDDGADALGGLLASQSLPNLEILNLSNCLIGAMGVDQIAAGLASCPSLRQLNLSNNPIGGNIRRLACSLGPKMEHLSIFNALLDPTAVDHLVSQWQCGTSLLTLNMSWNRISTSGAKVLARYLANGSCLTALNLSHNYIQGDALPALALAFRSTGLRTTLRRLNLGWNPLSLHRSLNPSYAATIGTGLGPQHQLVTTHHHSPALLLDPMTMHAPFLRLLASSLADCLSLEALNMSNVDLGLDGAVAFATGLGEGQACRSLRSLSMSWNRVGAVGAQAMARLLRQSGACPQLVMLDISYNAIGDVGATALAEAGSECQQQDLMFRILGNAITSLMQHHVPARELATALHIPQREPPIPTAAGALVASSPTAIIPAAAGLSRAQSSPADLTPPGDDDDKASAMEVVAAAEVATCSNVGHGSMMLLMRCHSDGAVEDAASIKGGGASDGTRRMTRNR